ncbi:DUF3073 domain-containing protein [Jiangella rhizosphaerae]|uniref:DUF3073 domain-containing protein n=1 Tax=Jiangella rhizosphaerae TaxID=2293569 RepID=A0A418KXV0_9ACTN|nr:DUF3073 domain-containing protein [Jiangella rhizosphaerae]RIQ36751.1 DUF3073 domain-containing protein [Jiangella rhizosphaerae]
MGRGRAKAKQTKVARRLKYQTLDTDFGALQRELGADGHAGNDNDLDEENTDEYEAYSRYLDDDDDEPRRHAG